ncbi:MAG: RNA methyltransferase substrate-binding domain-containing protein, partial [Burkholderiales bacterium]
MKKIFPSPVSIQTLFGFHAIRVRYKTAPETILEVYFDQTRRDQRMRDFLQKLEGASLRLIESDDDALHKICGTSNHQGVVARVKPLQLSRSLDGTLETFAASELMLLVLDGVTDPHNLGACLRVADGAGAQAVIAPKDHAVGINATVSKVASGAAETVPYFMVTNLARTLNELK